MAAEKSSGKKEIQRPTGKVTPFHDQGGNCSSVARDPIGMVVFMLRTGLKSPKRDFGTPKYQTSVKIDIKYTLKAERGQ